MNTPHFRAIVAVITHSRPKGLKHLLEELSLQEAGAEYEVSLLVVDNACDPEIRELVERIAIDCPFALTYEDEPVRGIVAARNHCVATFLESNSDFLLFIDDDSWPAGKDWVVKMIDGRNRLGVDVVASDTHALRGKDTPAWAAPIIHDFGGRPDGERISVFYTSNLLISRGVLSELKPAFDSRFAMSGGSDYHFSLKCLRAGFSAAYVDASVEEVFPASRAKVKWFVLRGYRSGNAYTRAHVFEEGILKAAGRSLLMSMVRFVRGIGYFVAGLLTFDKGRLVNGIFRVASGVGTLTGLVGAVHSEYAEIHGD